MRFDLCVAAAAVGLLSFFFFFHPPFVAANPARAYYLALRPRKFPNVNTLGPRRKRKIIIVIIMMIIIRPRYMTTLGARWEKAIRGAVFSVHNVWYTIPRAYRTICHCELLLMIFTGRVLRCYCCLGPFVQRAENFFPGLPVRKPSSCTGQQE